MQPPVIQQRSPLLSVGPVADVLGVSPSMVRKLIRVGDIPVVRVGKSVRVRQSDLDEYIAKGGSTD